jgi:hypothetical protein
MIFFLWKIRKLKPTQHNREFISHLDEGIRQAKTVINKNKEPRKREVYLASNGTRSRVENFTLNRNNSRKEKCFIPHSSDPQIYGFLLSEKK